MTELDRLAWTAALLHAFEERGLELPELRYVMRRWPTVVVDCGREFRMHGWRSDVEFGCGLMTAADDDIKCSYDENAGFNHDGQELAIATMDECCAMIADQFARKEVLP